MGLHLVGILRDSEGGLRKGSICLCRSSVTGTWRGPLLRGSRRIWGGELRGAGVALLGGPAGEPGRGLVYQGLVKALKTGISLHRGPIENNGGGEVCSPGTLER